MPDYRSADKKYYRSAEQSVIRNSHRDRTSKRGTPPPASRRPAKLAGGLESSDKYYVEQRGSSAAAGAPAKLAPATRRSPVVTSSVTRVVQTKNDIQAVLADLPATPEAITVQVSRDLVSRFRTALDHLVARGELSEQAYVRIAIVPIDSPALLPAPEAVAVPATPEPVLDTESMIRNLLTAKEPAVISNTIDELFGN